MDKLKKLFIYLFNLPLYWISKLISKDENIWIFGAWFGEKYGDNSKYLFEYVNKYQPQIQAIWLTKNNNIYNLLQSKGYKVYYAYSFKAILYGMRAKYSIFIQSNDTDNMFFLNNQKTFQIQLWHGTPLKKIGLDNNLIQYKKSTSKELLFPFTAIREDLMIAMSNADKENFQTAFDVKQISITGYPRNDILFTSNKSKGIYITYLPTFRDSVGDKIDLFSDYLFNIDKWTKTLDTLKLQLNIKMHPVNKPNDLLLEMFETNQRINFLQEQDVAEILTSTTILITDYSSVYFDYLLTDKPIIFAPLDYQKYITKDRELYYDYEKVTPGPKCKDWDEVLSWIKKFKNDPTLFSKERKEVRDRFHKYQDAKSCERVFDEILKLNG